MSGLNMKRVERIVRFALKEDVWTGDITSESVIDPNFEIRAVLIARQKGVICGVDAAEKAYRIVDEEVRVKFLVNDGAIVNPEQEVAFIEGRATSILRAERVAINYLGLLSGIATNTKKMADILKGTKTKIYDTRKTIPLQRYLQKYAVRVGGGENHRMGLWDMVLLKDNHLRIFAMQHKTRNNESIIKNIIKTARSNVQKNIRIEVEVETLKELEYALSETPDIIMLDNMKPEMVKKAVEMRKDKGLEDIVLLEVSGGITLDNIKEYADAGVDMISSGSLTSGTACLDFSQETILRT